MLRDLNPKLYGGLQNTVFYKNLTVDFLFYFKKQDSYNFNKNYVTLGAGIVNNPIQMTDRHSTYNPNAAYMPASYGNSAVSALSRPFAESDNAVSDASYIRLKNLSISYSLKIPKAKIESLKLYLQGQNLLTITNYKGMDPEFTTYGYLPPLKTYAFGVQLAF